MGTMFFLSLPLNKTLETLSQVKHCGDTALPDPDLYIIVNGRPMKGKVVWRSLVDINRVKAAIQKLKESNWLYKEVFGHSEIFDRSRKHDMALDSVAVLHQFSGYCIQTVQHAVMKLQLVFHSLGYQWLQARYASSSARMRALSLK